MIPSSWHFMHGSRKIASATSFFFGISKLCGTGKSIPEPIDSSSNQVRTTSPSSSSPSVPADNDLDLRLASYMYTGNDEQPKSSFEAYLISKTNLLTPFDSLASSSSFKFTTAASAAEPKSTRRLTTKTMVLSRHLPEETRKNLLVTSSIKVVLLLVSPGTESSFTMMA